MKIEPGASFTEHSATNETDCGNRVLDPGEQCDDGNTSNTDYCLNSCMLATCNDGFRNRDAESDVDCGGTCEPCEIGFSC